MGPFLDRGRGGSRYGFSWVRTTSVRFHPLYISSCVRVVGEDQLPGRVNYFIGDVPANWHTNIPTFARIRYQHVYPGIDLVYYGKSGHLEYDWVIKPGGNPARIGMQVAGGTMSLAGKTLLIHTRLGVLREPAPSIYQSVGGHRVSIAGSYVIAGGAMRLRLGAYDHSRPLVVDPSLAYSTYLGGSISDGVQGIEADASGNAYVTGLTGSPNFPVTPGAFQTTIPSFTVAFVSKLNAAGSALVYSTYLGGSSSNEGRAIAVDASGNAYVTGDTDSANFPTTSGSLQPVRGCSSESAFVTKLNPSGSALVYSTYLGASAHAAGFAIAVGSTGNAYVTGVTSSGFPVTPGAFQTTTPNATENAFVAALNAAGSALVYATYFSQAQTNGTGIAVDDTGSAYTTGNASGQVPTTAGAFQPIFGGVQDAYIMKLNPAGNALVYSTMLGGSSAEMGTAIAVDAAHNAYVTGSTSSTNFPITAGALQTALAGGGDAYVSKLNATGSALVYSTYLGGSADDLGAGIAVDASGNADVAGYTNSLNFPTTPNAFQPSLRGSYDIFLTRLIASGASLSYSTDPGGTGPDIGTSVAVDPSGNAYVGGYTSANDFPTTPGAFQPGPASHPEADGVVAKFIFPSSSPAPPGYAASYQAPTVGFFACTPQSYGVTLTNTGTTTWMPGTVQLHVAFSTHGGGYPNSLPWTSAQRFNPPTSVPPGRYIQISIRVNPPCTRGNYVIEYQLVVGASSYFSTFLDKGTTVA